MITLPKDWANSVGLNKNDTVGIQVQSDGTLLLYPKSAVPTPKRSTKVIDASKIVDRDFFYRQLVAAYIAGHTTILIKSSQPMTSLVISTVTNFVQTSIGLEMIEADDSHILIANLIEHDAMDPRKTIERMGLLVKSMISDLYEAALTGDYDTIKEMENRDTEIDRIYWLTYRQCNIYQRDAAAPHKMRLPLYEMTACLSLSRVLESIGDHLTTIAECLLILKEYGEPSKIGKNPHKLGQRVITLLTNVLKSWIDKDMVLAEQLIKEADELISETGRLTKINVAADSGYMSSDEIMLFSTQRISEYCKDIAEFTHNMAME